MVATVEALPRQKLAQRVCPLKPVAGEFTVVDGEQAKAIAAENAARYVPYVRAFDALDSTATIAAYRRWYRSEEHTSELQSLMRISYAVFCLKKKNTTYYTQYLYTRH